ncbi:YncE family protein [Salinibacter grassmerensis]|uniref:YncE family protein n=1 Tax=Salinibacter grassmerensis TaxID=3040353 RepID=UPI0021E81204|nr:YncE family protein [Salinibacter grassmerensis]
MRTLRAVLAVLLAFCLLGLVQAPAFGQDYYAYVASESADEVALVRFNAETESATVEETVAVGYIAPETEGAHGMTVAPNGEHWFVSIAHGKPYGRVAKYETGTNAKVDTAHVGMFPATMEISSVTGLLYVANFNLHGEPEPGTVSAVDPEAMTEVDQIETGIMPHGSRFAPDGRTHYSVSMMDGTLHEIDALTGQVTRTLTTGEGTPKPTWADPHPSEPFVYVAHNGADEVAVVDRDDWTVTQRLRTGEGTAPYNLEVAPDGSTLVVSYKGTGETGIWNLETGERAARLSNTQSVTHGVVVAPDSRYAFVSAEGRGDDPGAVDVVDLGTNERVASVEVGPQAGGIAFWKVEKTTTSAR